MGTFRLLLAFAVVISHTRPLFGFVGIGGNAVPAFFIISGFYMDLVLSTTYRGGGGTRLFYGNRLLRIFPTYWAVLLIFGIAALLPGFGIGFLQNIAFLAHNSVTAAIDGGAPAAWAAIPNLFAIGSDILRLFAPTPHGLTVLSPEMYARGDVAMDRYLILPPVWSLGVELICYAFSPIFARLRFRWLLVLFIAFVVIQEWTSTLTWILWRNLPFWYNVAYFLLGMLARRLMAVRVVLPRSVIYLAATLPFALWACYGEIVQALTNMTISVGWGAYLLGIVLLWAMWAAYSLGIVTLFSLTSRSTLDRHLGNLSYPVYLVHWLFAWPAVAFGSAQPVVAIVVSCTVAWCLTKVIDDPIEKIRRRRAMTRQLGRSNVGQTIAGPPVPAS